LHNYAILVRSEATQRAWIVKSYGETGINSDPYYNENWVLSDLPSGAYQINVPFAGINYRLDIQILPGQITYFTFQGYKGFTTELPPSPPTDIQNQKP
ncbi:MAG: hypothetical protein KKC71_05640, partial [Chloroflexi bacterium]|nr:hypothetical protein [Chloroflexota bacterium]